MFYIGSSGQIKFEVDNYNYSIKQYNQKNDHNQSNNKG